MAWVLNAVVNSVLQGDEKPAPGSDAKHAATPARGPAFIASPSFTGAKPGYLFKRDKLGLGYYVDSKQASAAGGQDAGGPSSSSAPAKRALDPDELLKQAEEDANVDEIQLLDAKGLRRLILSFQRKHKDNMEQRLKYAEQPEKFLDSEVDLDEQIKSLLQVAGSPELYPIMVEMGSVPTLLACLSHENTDIAADTIELFSELTGSDAVEGYIEEGKALVSAMLENNALELLVQRLMSLDEKVEDEAKAVYNVLTTFENLIEVDTQVAQQLVERTRLLKWLLARIRPREFDSNKQQASDLLAILVQGNEVVQRKVSEVNGIDTLLQCVSLYKSRDPASFEEEEFMQNCFDILCSCLMLQDNKQAFVKAEGVELMWIMLQSKKQSRYGALKLLDFASTRFATPCEKLVDLGGLKHIFGAFMGKARIKGPGGGKDVETEIEERSVSIIFNLFQNLGPRGGRRERVAAKFVEAEFEKCDRLMELYFRYGTRVAAQEARVQQELDEDEQVDADDLMLAKMDAGLFTLQQCAIILAHLWGTGDVGLRKRILMLLHQKGQTLANIKDVLVEYHDNIGLEGGAEEQLRLRGKAKDLLTAMGLSLDREEGEEGGQQGGAAAAGKDAQDGVGALANGAGKARPPPPPLPESAPPPLPPPTRGERAEASGRKALPDTADDMDVDMDVDAAPPPRRGGATVAAAAPERRSEDRREDRDQERAPRGREVADGREWERERAEARDEDRGRDKERDRAAGGGSVGREERDERRRPRSRSREREREKERERGRDRHEDARKERAREADRDKDSRRDRRRSRSR